MSKKEAIEAAKRGLEILDGGTGSYSNELKAVTKLASEQDTFTAKEYGEAILTKDRFLHFRDSDDLYRFNTSIYEEYADQYVKEICNKLLSFDFTVHRANEVIGYIKSSNSTKVMHLSDHNECVPLTLIPLANGVYNMVTETISPYTPEEPFFARIPVAFDPKAECPRFKQFLTEVVPEGDIGVLQEFLGYCLYRDYPYARALLLVGGGHNGKSTFLHLVGELLGNENISDVSLQSLCENTFAAAQLVNKYANIYADLPDKSVYETGIFKILTGNDRHSVERKHKQPFDTKNYAKLMFSCNKIPESYDDTDAYYRRWIIVTFPNQFMEGDPKTDPQLIEKLREELPGILNYALAGLQRLLQQQKFSTNKSLEETRLFYKRQASSVAAFVEDSLEMEPQSELTKDGVYSSYCTYCRSASIASVAKPTFGKKLPQYIEVSTGRSNEKGRAYIWRGIRFKNEAEDKKQGDLDAFQL